MSDLTRSKESNGINKLRIKAIETKYKGYRFRSRLEARWAVFFDSLKIEWEYEKEGYDLGKFGYYLPDFWFPHPAMKKDGWGIWCEIKPYDITEEAFEKIVALAVGTKHNALVFQGYPEKNKYSITKISVCHVDTPVIRSGLKFMPNPKNNNYVHLVGEDGFASYPLAFRMNTLDLENAYITASSARFEHGENRP